MFKKGDRVKVVTKRHGREQFGLVGTLIEGKDTDGWYRMETDDEYRNAYQDEDLEYVMPPLVEDTRTYLAAVTGEQP